MTRRKDTVIACYSLKGKLIRVYPTATAAARSRHLFKRTIDRATRRDVLTIKNLMWRRVDKNSVPEFIEPLVVAPHSNKKKSVAKVDENNKVIETYSSISEAARKNKIDPHTLRDRLNGKYSSNNKTKFVSLESLSSNESNEH